MLLSPIVAPVSLSVSIKAPRRLKRATRRNLAFDVKQFLDSTGLGRKVGTFDKKETVFAQGDPAKHVMYIQDGGVKLTVVNETGREAVVAILGPGDFFGEGCLGGQHICMATAATIAPTTVLVIEKSGPFHRLHARAQYPRRRGSD
jgi:CRP/FNR family cyclic AMP-dependent transcriptional regulator